VTGKGRLWLLLDAAVVLAASIVVFSLTRQRWWL
jgi:hypothetical protein